MKINPAPQTLAMLAWIAWGVVGLESFLIDMLAIKPFAALVAAAATVSVAAAMRYHGQRVEESTREHAALMSKQILTIERFFEMGVRSDTRAKIDVADSRARNGHGTGPFRVYNGA